jgi:hypothetical protein
MDAAEATNGPDVPGPGGGGGGGPGAVIFKVTGIIKETPDESVAARFTLPWYCPRGNNDVFRLTVRVAGVVFINGPTISHCAPLDVVRETPTAPKVIGAPVLFTVKFCCVTLLEAPVAILNVIDAMDAVS